MGLPPETLSAIDGFSGPAMLYASPRLAGRSERLLPSMDTLSGPSTRYAPTCPRAAPFTLPRLVSGLETRYRLSSPSSSTVPALWSTNGTPKCSITRMLHVYACEACLDARLYTFFAKLFPEEQQALLQRALAATGNRHAPGQSSLLQLHRTPPWLYSQYRADN